ncbi:VacJ family lipoprotein [Glaciimonas sp. CA11.2]|uniref:MlaA family lipoprotein n=1 Tax=unclassified Glaciimonas TaxID=2644401 RepID=UPI002AB38A2E|nr:MULTISPECIES: VacJ family lipoprotein [unclassified Glaciimonas]MDY7546576.1 VacJ family lipoprotein [Glaciimonas sp. CA11.2]MEB0011702.1 VacJ family lipoprotein [Glaciimonas sp. Cout2]MEB0080742.1 VacJ family lipoprotein [Glaciimonas sp. Gout2]MEB0165220.1 VacJ family lipoprotein [Glaciimonas sp. CA11.2]
MKTTTLVSALAVVAVMSGCATTGGASNPQDPLEGFNRAMFTVNDKFDQIALKPVATAYRNWLPSFVQTGVNNFFGNLADVWSAANGYLQGNGVDGTTAVMRVAVNTTFGLGGLLDVSSAAGLQKKNKDFGQTLGVWGVGSGPYLVLPLFGPSNIRDAAALPVDFYGDIWTYKYPVRWRNTGSVVRLVDKRANLLDASTLLEDAALDKYEFVRDAYTQRRQSQIDGPNKEDN